MSPRPANAHPLGPVAHCSAEEHESSAPASFSSRTASQFYATTAGERSYELPDSRLGEGAPFPKVHVPDPVTITYRAGGDACPGPARRAVRQDHVTVRATSDRHGRALRWVMGVPVSPGQQHDGRDLLRQARPAVLESPQPLHEPVDIVRRLPTGQLTRGPAVVR